MNVGYKRVILIAVVSTTFAVILDHYGVFNYLADRLPF